MLRAVIQKEFRLLARDRGTLLRLFLLPVMFILVFGSVFHFGPDGDATRGPAIAVWTPPGDARFAPLAAGGAGFQVQPRATPAEVRAAVARGDVAAGVVVPPDVAPGAHPVELVMLPSQPAQTRLPLQGALTALVAQALLGGGGTPAALVEVRPPPGLRPAAPPPSGFQVAVPGNAVLFGFFISLTVAIAFAEERRSGAWRRALAAPVDRRVLLLGKLVPYTLVGLGQQAFLYGVSMAVFGLHVAGSPLALLLMAVTVALCAVSLGLAIASLGGSEKQIGSVGSMTILLMGLLGGCMLPRLIMPVVMQRLGLAVPHGWALDGFYAVLMTPGTGVADIAPQLGAMLGFAVVFSAFGAWRFRYQA